MTKSTIYLDNAATTWPKPEEVYRAVDTAMREHGANPGRGSYRMSVDAQRMVDETRQAVCRLFNAPAPERVIFTLNCTDALCLALKGLIKSGDRVVTGPFEHNSVMRPLHSLRRCGAQVEVMKSTAAFGIDLDHFRALCRERVDYVVISHVSNVTGCVAPIKDIAAITHERGGLLILDAAQSAGDLADRHAGFGRGCSGCSRTQGALRAHGDRRAGVVRCLARAAVSRGRHRLPVGKSRTAR